MNYISKAFQIQYLSYYKLYVVSGHQEELLVVMDDAEQVRALIRYPSDVPSVEATKLLALPFREVSVVLPQQNVTFIPKEVYRADDRALYSEYLMNKNDLDIQSVDLEEARVTALFQYDSVLWKRWSSLYPEATFVPAFVPLFNQVGIDTISSGSKLLIHVDVGSAHFLLLGTGQFKFYNTFHADTWQDIMYYTLKITKSLDVVRLDDILLTGRVSEEAYVQRLSSVADRVSVWQHGMESNDIDLGSVSNLNLVVKCRSCVS